MLSGVAVGVVTDNKDPENLARVRVRLPWHAGSDTSYWARPAMPMAGPGRGTYFLPEVGDEVLVAAENGDPSHLYVLGMVWNGKQLPPERNSDGKNDIRVIKSRLGHTIRFNDDEAAPQIEVRLASGKRVALDKDGITIDDANNNVVKLSSTSGAIDITAAKQISVKAPTISLEASASMTVKSSGTLTLSGAIVRIN
ncbi:hypothetical protein BG844_11105 [Couchioplanes caeruleus subsp. caeruleus]|uniref:Gp5/Type VI secretion system Vgr protein OB-fold domain-containing protein n=1 Tax=Couchioplanes caeruleus subsp. caeruleus TaxID=56427 RepID=A0A1K0FND2_9ACTN|nr:hypothetical protein BG844_11105 [Couchioplanes caeruleus subsp. caeruleus]